jgi:hypothetical protein
MIYGDEMSVTRGGPSKGKRFRWHFDEGSQKVRIENEDRKDLHSYTVEEIQAILKAIYREFKQGYFPLADNVKHLGHGTEKMGLGRAILDLKGSTISHAQGSSYLGVVLEECGYLLWNGEHKGIQWWRRSWNESARCQHRCTEQVS